MIALNRLAAAGVVLLLAMPGTSPLGQEIRTEKTAAPGGPTSAVQIPIAQPAVGQAPIAQAPIAQAPVAQPAVGQGLWDSVRSALFGTLDYGAQVVSTFGGWLGGGGGESDTNKIEDIRGLLSLSDKEFREFETLVRSAGYELQGYSFGLGRSLDMEMVFDFERAITDKERADLYRLLDQQGTSLNAVRRSVIDALLEASKYIDASPASGYRLTDVVVRVGASPDVRLRFRRVRP